MQGLDQTTLDVRLPWGLAITSSNVLIHHWTLFLLGMAAFFRLERILSNLQLTVLIVATLGFGLKCLGAVEMVVGSATALAIVFWKNNNRALCWLGSISYSLYLLHGPVGMKIINLISRYSSDQLIRTFVLVVAFIVSVVASWVLWKFVEMPSRVCAARVKYLGLRGGRSAPDSAQ